MMRRMTEPKKPQDPHEAARDAQARLDQLRHEAGGALDGAEARERAGLDPAQANPDPPLDWRMTPRNILLNLLAIGVFLAVAAFVVQTFLGGFDALIQHVGERAAPASPAQEAAP